MNDVKNRYLFEKMPVARAVCTMAVPTIFGQIIVLIYNIADTFFIGRTSDPSKIAGASFILPVFNILIALAAVAGVGGSALISRLLGDGRESEAKKVSSFSIYLSLAIALVYCVSVYFAMDPLLHLLKAEGAKFEYAKTYATWVIVFGGVPTIMTNVFSNLVRSVGESAKAGFGVTLGGVINIGLDPLFMFVLLPKGNEVLGAGIATCLSNIISCTYFIIVISKLSKTTVLGLLSPKKLPERASVGKILAIGLPSAFTMFLFDLDYMVIDALMEGHAVEAANAAIGIVLKAERLPLNIGVGICQGMVPIIAYNYASKNYKRMKEVSRFSLLLGIVCAIVSIILYEIFADYILEFFVSGSPDTVHYGANFLRIRSPATILMFMSFYHVHLFDSYGKGKEAFFLGTVRWAVFNIPMLFLMNHLVGMYGIVMSQFLADTMTVILSFAVHRTYEKKHFST